LSRVKGGKVEREKKKSKVRGKKERSDEEKEV